MERLMQLPGMTTDPVRLELELTWWPPSDEFSVARKLWTRPTASDVWQLEEMATSGSPIRLQALPGRWSEITGVALESFLTVILPLAEPFPDL